MGVTEVYRSVCRQNAMHVLGLAWRDQPAVGFEASGIEWVNSHIEQSRAHIADDLKEEFAQLMGSFYGECVIATFGGSWEIAGEEMAVRTEPYGFTFPFTAVLRQLDDVEAPTVADRFDAAVRYHANLAA